MTRRGVRGLIAAASLALGCAAAQVPPRIPPERMPAEVPAIVRFFAPLFPPKLLNDAFALRAYVRGDGFARVRREQGDRAAVDSLYTEAFGLSWGNTGEALLLCLAATLDHRRVGVELPLAGALLWFPLTSEFPDEFDARVAALPLRPFADSPAAGDRDKLQHFFGSAYAALVSESEGSARDIGDFVEWGEERFVVDGAADPRDVLANARGRAFGLALLGDPLLLPSGFLDRAPRPEAGEENP